MARTPARADLLHAGAVLAGYTAVALWVTRPLLWHFADHSLVAFRQTGYDIPFNAWVLSWVTHALVTQPLDLFSANIYHPLPDTLAYTEHMLGSIPFFAPGFVATGNPAVALNLMILAALVLSAAGAHWVTWRWTGSWPAAVFAGLLFGFYPTHVRALGPNLQTLQYLPLILLFLDRVLAGAGAGPTVGLTLAVLGQCLASYYYAYPAVLATAAAAVLPYACRSLWPSRGALLRVALALGVTAAVLILLSRPYLRVRAGGIHTYYSLHDWLPATPDKLLTHARRQLGAPAVLLGIAGLALAFRRRAGFATRRRVLILAAWVVVGHLLLADRTLVAGGYRIPLPGRLLHAHAPGYAALRARPRLFVVAEAALPVLAGIGIAAIAALRPGRGRTLVALGLAVGGLVVTARAIDLGPCILRPLQTDLDVPEVYRALAAREPGPVLELPLGAVEKDVTAIEIQTSYEYFSIFHWRPLLNGYASYWPPEFETVMAMARAVPAPRALANLVACTGVRWIVLHTKQLGFDPARIAPWVGPHPGLQLDGRFGDDLLYRVVLPGNPAACRAGLAHADPRVTLEGTPRTPLPAEARRAMIEAVQMRRAVRRAPAPAAAALVRLRNPTPVVWPAAGVGDRGLVRLTSSWLDAGGRPIPGRVVTRLPVDLRPGEVMDLPVAFRPPAAPGDYRLQIVIGQGPRDAFVISGPGATPVPVTVE